MLEIGRKSTTGYANNSIHSKQNLRNQRRKSNAVPIAIGIDLATLYGVETRVLNQAVKRNIERFPEDFMFQLKSFEYESIKNHLIALTQGSSSQFVMMNNLASNRTDKYLPYAFTESRGLGIAMLSGVLRSQKAISMNIAIMRAFVEVQKVLHMQIDLKEQMKEIRQRSG